MTLQENEIVPRMLESADFCRSMISILILRLGVSEVTVTHDEMNVLEGMELRERFVAGAFEMQVGSANAIVN